MILVDFFALLFSFLLTCPPTSAWRSKRQSGLEDLISGTINLIRPIFDAPPPPDGALIPRKISMSDDPGRAADVLGAPRWSSLQEVPICRNANSKICAFIACQAANFKQDESFANLNLAAQTLGDPKLRKTISANPEAIAAVCKDQGMSEGQCRLFARGFQLIDRFMNTIEKPPADDPPTTNAVANELPPVERTPPHVVDLQKPRSELPAGSHTWSARRVADSTRPARPQRIQHTTSRKADPLGMTVVPPHRTAAESPPRARRPTFSRPTVLVRPKRPPPPVDYDQEDEEEKEIEERPLRRPRARRPKRQAPNDYYDEAAQEAKPTDSTAAAAKHARKPPLMNCVNLLG